MKKLLFLTPSIPYPLNSGGVYNSYRVLEHLCKQHDVTLFAFDKTGDAKVKDDLANHVKPRAFVSQPLNRKRSAVNYVRSLVADKPLAVYRNYSPEAQLTIEQLAQQSDLIFVDHHVMFQYIPREFRKRVVVFTHNAEYVLWKTYSEQCESPIKKTLTSIEAYRMRRYEFSMVAAANAVLASENDLKAFLDLGCDAEHLYPVLHLGDDENLRREELDYDKTRPALLYIGTLTWEANIDGVIWLIENVWPLIRASRPDAEFFISGQTGNNQKLRDRLNQTEGVRYLGFVDDIETLYKESRVFVAPIRVGAGIKIKVLNALYRGIPTVSTSCGVEGLGCRHRESICIADDPSAFADEVLRLLNEKGSWLSLMRGGRKFASDNFSWPQVFKYVDQAIEDE